MDGWLWTSGQVALDPHTGALVGKDVAAQADRALRNIGAILEAAGSSWNQVVRATVFLTDMDDFATVNEVPPGIVPRARVRRGIAPAARGLGRDRRHGPGR
jgi:2-iminobutanoate/2-iminopropanoate deaminase